MILGGGLDLMKKYNVESERNPSENITAQFNQTPKMLEQIDTHEEEATYPQVAPSIAFQISATPYESKSAEPRKSDVVPRLQLDAIATNQEKEQEVLKHNIQMDSAAGLRPSNLMSSASSYVSNSSNLKQQQSGKRLPPKSMLKSSQPPLPRRPISDDNFQSNN